MKRRFQILVICILFVLGIIAILGGIMVFMNDGIRTMTPSEERIVYPSKEHQVSPETPLPGNAGYGLFLSTIDGATKESLENVSIYLDGGYEGSTVMRGPVAILNTSQVPEGMHTLRAVKPGYSEYTKTIFVPSDSAVTIGLESPLLTTVQEPGPHTTKIDIVFVPSGTTYNCAEQKKITTTRYVSDRSTFVTDVNHVVAASIFTLGQVTDKTDPIPSDYRDRFNIYYYYDSSEFADAFSGCAGTVPEKLWNSAPFADVVIILYPSYYSLDTGAPCEPIGCVNPGTGRKWMKTPADQDVLFMHECGHALFGLVDTYCENTLYWQNDPNPNVWSSEENCREDAKKNSWDPQACRQIVQVNPNNCTRQFWRWDTDPDIMHDGYSGTFGKASTRRITYTFDTLDPGRMTV